MVHWGWVWPLPLAVAGLSAKAALARVGGVWRIAAGGGPLVAGLIVSRWSLGTSWAVVQQEQLFYEAVATSISNFGRSSFLWAAGTPLHFHFLAHAEAGGIQRAIGGGTFMILPVILPTVFALGVMATLREIARCVDPRRANAAILVISALSGPVIYGQVGPIVVADAPFLLGALSLGCALLLAATDSVIRHRYQTALIAICVFTATGAKTMYGIIAAVAVAGITLARWRTCPRRLCVTMIAAAGIGSLGALVIFLGLPWSSPAGGSGIFGEPPFDFVRKLSSELLIFDGWRALVISALITSAVVATPLVVFAVAIHTSRDTNRRMDVGIAAALGAGLLMLIFGHTDLYGEQAVFWTAAAGPALAFGLPVVLSRLAATRVLGVLAAVAVGTLSAVAEIASGRHVGSGSTNAIYLRVMSVGLVPVVVVAVVVVLIVVRPQTMVVTGLAITSALCLAGSTISTIRGIHTLTIHEISRRNARVVSLVDRRAVVHEVAEWLDANTARDVVLAAPPGRELEMMNLSLAAARRFLYLEGGFWTMHVDRSSDAWRVDRTISKRAISATEPELRELAVRGVDFVILDSDEISSSSGLVAYRDDHWTVVATRGG